MGRLLRRLSCDQDRVEFDYLIICFPTNCLVGRL
jgi:hypothetical protein